MVRKLRNINGSELAEKLGVSPSAVTNYEKEVNFPDAEGLAAIGAALSVSVDWLLGLSEQMDLCHSGFVIPGVPKSLLDELEAAAKRRHFESKEAFVLQLMRDAALVSGLQPGDVDALANQVLARIKLLQPPKP